MPRAQKKRAARAAAASGRAPASRPAPERASQVAPRNTGPQPWSSRSLLILAGLVALLQIPLALIDSLRHGGGYGYHVFLIASLDPISLIQQIQILIAFVIVMPIARRLSGEKRSMGMLETLGLGAVTLIALTVLWQFAVIAAGSRPVVDKGHVATGALAAGAFADVAGLAIGALVYPRIQRWFRARSGR
jgi:hypothetical protein